MSKEEIREDFDRMFRELTDEEVIEENRKKHEREDRIKERQADTGYE
jgi:hypothetical protein